VPTQVLEVLSDPTPQVSPLWATFCGNAAGEWHGSAVAYNPIKGKAEPITLDANRKKVFELPCVTLEDRVVLEDGTDLLRRETFRACDAAAIATPDLRTPPDEDDDESPVIYDKEEIVDGEEGLVIFEAGAYSRGPSVIGSTEEFDETVCTIEQCLCWGGHNRVRCELVLSTSGGGGEEIDIDVLRLMVFYEKWEAPPGYCDTNKDNCQLPTSPGVVDANERLAPASLAGEWMAFDVGCLPLVDDLDGSGERPILAYFSSETRQAWAAPPAEPSERGISLWLPGNVGVSMSLTAGYSADDDDNPAGDNLGVGGVVFGLGWMARDGTWISLERDYSGEGVLREVRSSSACQGGWVGGAM